VVFFLFALVLPVTRMYRSRRAFVSRAGISALLVLLVLLGWSTRNYVIHDLFVFGTNGVYTLRSAVVTKVAEQTRGEGKKQLDYRREWEEEDNDWKPGDYQDQYRRAKARVVNEVKNNPGPMTRQFLFNLQENMVERNSYPDRQIPQVRSVMGVLNNAVRNWLGYLIIAVTLLGLALLRRNDHRAAAWLLGLTYAGFSILVGCSTWQGSRLHYPAEMAWSIVVAFVAVGAWCRLQGRRRTD